MASSVSGYVSRINPGNGTYYAIGSMAYGVCETAAGTAAKTVDMTGFVPLAGATIHVKFVNSNTASNPTLNVNSTGAFAIRRYGTTVPSNTAKTSWQAGSVISLTYDGDYWIMNDWLNDDTTYSAGTGLSSSGTTINHSNSVTAATAGQSGSTSGSTVDVPYVTYDAQGHVTASGVHTHTVTGFLTSHQTVKQDGVTGATVNRFGTCSVAAGTAAKTVSITTGTFSLEAGAKVSVKFTNANTANSPTLNVGSTGGKNIFHNGSQITSGANKGLLAGVCDFVYDGTQWHLVGNYLDTDTHHTAYLRAGASGGTANASTTTGNTFLNLVENSANRSGVKLVPGDNMAISSDASGNVTFTATDTTYSQGTGISISGTTISNSGVRSIATGSTNGTINVNTGGNSVDVAVKGLGSAACTASTDYIAATAKGTANGVAELDANGLVPTSQLPSYVDDVLEYTNKASFPATGETGKIYVDKATNLTYRWGGSAYVEISPSLALGTTSSTAFRGDYGQSAYTHAVTNKGSQYAEGLYKIGTNAEGHVTSATAVTKSDITALGIPGTDTDTHHTAYIRAGASGGTANAATTTGNTYLNLVENGANRSGVKLVPGTNMSITSDGSGNVTFNATDTNTDTLVNVTLANTTQAYLLGTSTTPTATAAGVTAVADAGVYIKNTAGALNATTYYVDEKVSLQYNSTTKSLDFIFV